MTQFIEPKMSFSATAIVHHYTLVRDSDGDVAERAIFQETPGGKFVLSYCTYSPGDDEASYADDAEFDTYDEAAQRF